MVIFENINKYYKTDFWKSPTRALKDISFTIKENSITGFLGHNGAGKTTCIKILLGLSDYDSGNIKFFNNQLNRQSLLKIVGYMPERPYYYQNSTAKELLTFFARLSNHPAKDTPNDIKYWSERLSLAHAIDWKVKSYSKGMLQRLGLIIAVIHRPQLIILDEPVSGMDPIGRKDIKEILKELGNKIGTTIFFSTHIIPDVEEICDEIIFIKNGETMYEGSKEHLIYNENYQYKITYSTNEGQQSIIIKKNLKELKLKELLNSGAKILKFEPNIKNLEDILYESV